MALRHILKSLAKRSVPVVYAGLIYARCQENSPKNEEEVSKINLSKFERLPYDSLIKQSTIDAVNSASQALTVVSTSFESASEEYRSLLSRLMSLMEETLMYQVNEQHRDLIIAVRCEVNRKRQILTELQNYMDYVQRMVEAVSVVSQSAGMDNLAMTLCERMDHALKYKEQEIRNTMNLEKEYSNLQEKCIKES